jgi:DTW domain-containing protein YfiP
MSKRRNRRPKHPGFGQGKHRKARVLRFAARHKGSEHIPCPECGLHRARCICQKEAVNG